MRDQVVAQKVGNRSGMSGKGRGATAGQRPIRRDRESQLTFAARMRSLLAYLPFVLKAAAILVCVVLVFLGYRAAASASFFKIKNIEVAGITRASTASIETTVRRDLAETGVWRADLSQLSSHLEHLPWIRTAIVGRVLPDGIRVRITERQPRVVIRTSVGRFIWVDEDAVLLSEMKPTDRMPDFFLRGWNEDGSSAATVENKARVQKFLELQKDWNALALSDRVSEVNLGDVRDIRAQLSGDDSQIEIRLGAEDHGQRLKKALTVLDSQRQTARGPLISYIDMTQSSRAIVGLSSGSRVSDVVEEDGEPSAVSRDDRTRTEKTSERNVKDSKGRNQVRKSEQKPT